jgi:hypothetical protein
MRWMTGSSVSNVLDAGATSLKQRDLSHAVDDGVGISQRFRMSCHSRTETSRMRWTTGPA